MFVDGCLSCDTLTGKFQAPGGIVYENANWMIVMRARPMIVGQTIIILKRHCEEFNDLTVEELHSMSETMQIISKAYQPVLQPEKVHFGLYGESVKHIHLHVLPRTSDLPPGNKLIRYLRRWHQILQFFGLKRPYSDEQVARVANELQSVIETIDLRE